MLHRETACGLAAAAVVVCAGGFAHAQRLAPEFQVNTFTVSEQFFPAVSSAAGGQFVIVWQSYTQDGEDWGVFGRRYDADGTPLGLGPFQVNTNTAGYQNFASVAVDPSSGAFVVVWQSGEGLVPSFSDILGRRYDATGLPLDIMDFQVNTSFTGYQLYPSVATQGSGSFVVVWGSEYQSGDIGGIWGRRYDSLTGWGGEFHVNTTTAGYQAYPRVASDSSGNFVVVWETGGQNVSAQRFLSAGTADGGEITVNTFTTASGWPSVSSDQTGNFVVAWQDSSQDGSDMGVVARRFGNNGSALDVTEFQVNTFFTGAQWIPSVSRDADANFVVTWTSAPCRPATPRSLDSCDPGLVPAQDGSGSGVYARRYGSNGSPTPEGELLINSTTTNDQRASAVTANGTFNFTIAWSSRNQDGDLWGVFARSRCPDISISPPASQSVCVGSNASFSVSATGGRGTLLYQWRKDGAPLSDGGSISGATTPTLTITGVVVGDAGSYDCVVSDTCTPSVASSPASLAVDTAVPSAVGNTFRVAKSDGNTKVHFTWTDVSGATLYRVYEDTVPSGSFVSVAGTAASGTTGLKIDLVAETRYYHVAANNSCGESAK